MKTIKFSIYSTFLLFTHFLMGDFHLRMSQNSLNGDTISAWEDFTASGNNILASVQTGGTWVPAIAIANPATLPTLPFTAINNSGQMVVIWIGNDVSTFIPSLYASTFASGSWTTVLLSDPLSEYVIGNHKVKIADNGAIVVNWVSYIFTSGTNEARGIYAPTYGTWPAPITLP